MVEGEMKRARLEKVDTHLQNELKNEKFRKAYEREKVALAQRIEKMAKKRITTEQALLTVFAYHYNPNWGGIPDDEIDAATLFLAKYVKALEKELVNVLEWRLFDTIKRKDKAIYSAWCVRILETVDMRCEDIANEKTVGNADAEKGCR